MKNFKKLSLYDESIETTTSNSTDPFLGLDNVSESCIEFATWLQDNYSQNKKQGSTEMLPKGYMREDFTDNTFPISEIWRTFNSR